MSEIAQAYKWAVATMKGDSALTTAATGGVWQGFADIGTAGPYALVARQGGQDALTLAVVRIFSHISLQIKAVGPANNYAALVTIAGRIDALFKRTGPAALPDGGGVIACWREQEVAYSELVNGAQWEHLGGLYHLELQGA